MTIPSKPGEPVPWPARLTVRERYALPAPAALELAAGLWLGLWMVPNEVLAVPTETPPHGGVSTIYQPVPEMCRSRRSCSWPWRRGRLRW
ncbi:hypothetical protein [Halorhabdus amylolytica]|uniref:hypothetical protein n=1 Tax=Halorhabdus amylolytica TaxID=2559573 RepID=UPI0010AA52A3|nr:hypothetical protein [Halorhabdus amylolytica]